MTEIAIPTCIADITPAWLTAALGTTPAHVVDVHTERIGVGIGLMADEWRVTLTYDQPLPNQLASVVVKLAASAGENRAIAHERNLYESEVRFYRELAPQTRTRVPQCFHARKASDGADFVIVMEDLSALGMVDQLAGLSLVQAEQAVTALADLHASWWGKVSTPELDWIPSIVHPRMKMMADLWPQLWPVFVQRFGTDLPDGGEALGEEVLDRYWPFMQQLADEPWTILHIDYRCENLMFQRDGTGLVVLDWQSIGRGPGAYDLAYLLGGSLTAEVRAAHEEALVERYHRELVKGGVQDYPLDRLWAAYRLAHRVAGTATAVLVGAGTDLGNERGVELVRTMTNRHFSAAVDAARVASSRDALAPS
ncbi:phosphotransferase [Frankia sp. Cr2]|uniref:phosphotransferase n=1 Tax=Frankia sp. Cr2 TaxID=3073932 RepID=UPI002AD1D285|nr:phosphotransferase [Frankia sp. Cr2]